MYSLKSKSSRTNVHSEDRTGENRNTTVFCMFGSVYCWRWHLEGVVLQIAESFRLAMPLTVWWVLVWCSQGRSIDCLLIFVRAVQTPHCCL